MQLALFFLTLPFLSPTEELTTDYMQVVDRCALVTLALSVHRCGFQESEPFVEPRKGT